jgi:hypothetical protein
LADGGQARFKKIYRDFPDDKVVDGIVKSYNALRPKWDKSFNRCLRAINKM